MRKQLFLFAVVGVLSFAGFPACGDGEEKNAGGTGGVAGGGGTGGDASGQCPSADFSFPADGAVLAAGQDQDQKCSNGIQLDVTVATNAKAGTSATLLDGTQEIGTTTVSGALLKFANVTLQSTGSSKLTVRFDDVANCEASINVTEACGDVECTLAKPALSATHPELNGVPVAQGGDRASAPGQDYQVAFEVSTNIEDGQPVTLTVDGKANAAVAIASGGVATFPGVTLTPDGDHTVQAACSPKTGEPGSSAQVTYPVDTTPPDLTNVAPADGHFFGPADDTNAAKTGLQFKICGETSAADAIDLPSSLGTAASNFCVGVGSATPTCTAATTGGAPAGAKGGCVELDCPGGAPFDVNVTLTDDAGNPTTDTIQGVRCASSLPSVQIVEPVAGTGADVTTHILAATTNQVRKDQDAGTKGAQYTVVACTDVASGTARLFAQLAGATKAQVGTATPAVAQVSDNCPAGLGNVVKFTNVTLPESAQAADNTLATATELVVEVEDVSTAKNSSPAVQVWVDSEVPTIGEWVPNPLCGKLYQSTTSVNQALSFLASNVPVTLVVTSNGTPVTYNGNTASNGIVNFGNVTFAQGTNDITATTKEPSGNSGALKSPCTVTVGNPPIVTWTSPTSSTMLNATTDGNGASAGWQGNLSVSTDVGGSGGTVTFKVTCGATVTTLGTANIDASGNAALSGVTLPDCISATLTAETSNIASKGVGTANLTKAIDTVVPGVPTGLTATVLDRRATSFTLSWTAPADGSGSVGGYLVKVSKSPITGANFDAAENVAFLGSPKAAGQTETLDVNSRIIETNYYFAVAATDAAGNQSAIVSAGPAKATFNSTVLNGTGVERMGTAVDGWGDLNGDGFSDLVVGGFASTNVYVWFGSATGFAASPNVTITGPASVRFGQFLSVVGDVDSDGFQDIAVGAVLDGGNGRVYVFRGRANWPATVASGTADTVVNVDPAQDSKFTGAVFGSSITRLGDLDQDGAADFAIGAYLYGVTGTRQGYVAVVRGVPAGQSLPAAITIPQDVGTRVIAFVGDPAKGNGWFGFDAVGLPGYYTGGHPALVVAAASAGTLYSFQGDTGLTGTILAATAKETYVGSVGGQTGSSLANIGPIGAVASIGAGTPMATTTGGDVRIFLGTPSAVLPSTPVTVTNSAATTAGDSFGLALFGGGFAGSSVNVSFIGSSGVDVAISSRNLAGAAAKVYLVEGSKLASGGGDIVTLADVVYALPTDWRGSSAHSGPIKDLNKDGYGDLAFGEQRAGQTYPGRVVVLW